MDNSNPVPNRKAYAEANFAAFADPLVSVAVEQASALRDGANAEKLHKLRVALRRLRTLLWAYGPILDEAFDDRQRAHLKRLASAAGNTRDWDILIGLAQDVSDQDLLAALQKKRDKTAEKSARVIRGAHLDQALPQSMRNAKKELGAAGTRTRLGKFAQKRVQTAQKQLQKRMRHALRAGSADYEAYHDVRKAGKKVRYLIEFFDPLLKKRQRRRLKSLKRLQKHYGALNDVVASRALLASHRQALPKGVDARPALRELTTAQKQRTKVATKLLKQAH